MDQEEFETWYFVSDTMLSFNSPMRFKILHIKKVTEHYLIETSGSRWKRSTYSGQLFNDKREAVTKMQTLINRSQASLNEFILNDPDWPWDDSEQEDIDNALIAGSVNLLLDRV